MAAIAVLGVVTAAAPALAQPDADVPRLGTCVAQPAGFFAIPGSDTCLRIGGFVASEIGTGWASAHLGGFAPAALGGAPALPPASSRRLDTTRSAIDARLSLDVRTQTELGPLRVYVSMRHPGALARP